MTQLSKQTIVQGDFCPRKLLPIHILPKLIFFIETCHTSALCNEKKKYEQPSSWQYLLLGQKSSWTNVYLDNRPWTIFATPDFLVLNFVSIVIILSFLYKTSMGKKFPLNTRISLHVGKFFSKNLLFSQLFFFIDFNLPKLVFIVIL